KVVDQGIYDDPKAIEPVEDMLRQAILRDSRAMRPGLWGFRRWRTTFSSERSSCLLRRATSATKAGFVSHDLRDRSVGGTRWPRRAFHDEMVSNSSIDEMSSNSSIVKPTTWRNSTLPLGVIMGDCIGDDGADVGWFAVAVDRQQGRVDGVPAGGVVGLVGVKR